MIFKRIFETIALLVLIQLVANANGQCQQKDYDEADEAFQFITVFGHPKTSFPESDPDFQQLCKKYQNDLTRLKTFARKCLNAFSKQTFGLLLRGVSREMKRYCVKEREAFLVHNKCGGATITETKQCHSQLVKELKQIINAEQDSKIPFVCCATYNFQDCLFNAMSNNKECTKADAKEFKKLAKGYTADARAVLCGGFEEGSARCAEANKTFKKLPMSTVRSKSVLLAFLEITKTIIM